MEIIGTIHVKGRRCIAMLLLAVFTQQAGFAAETLQTAVVPSEFENSAAPGSDLSFANRGRFLSYYRSEELIQAMPQGGFISEVSFRLNEDITLQNAASVPDIEVRLSTGALPGLNESRPFSDHVGQDEIVVFPRGSIDVREILAPWDPQRFDIAIKFKDAFYYDPRAGHLAFDLRIYERSSRVIELDTGKGVSH